MTQRRPALAFADAMEKAAEEGKGRLVGVSRCHSTWHASLALAAMYAASVSPCIFLRLGARHWCVRLPCPGTLFIAASPGDVARVGVDNCL